MINSIDPDETAHYEPSHLDLHCLHRYWFWPAGLKGSMANTILYIIVSFRQEKCHDDNLTCRCYLE